MEGIKLLLVEDDAIVSMGLRMRLEKLGFDIVAEAANGIEAIAAVKHFMPNVILMDIKMPQMGGLEAAQVIKEKYSIPIIFLTAFDEVDLIEKAGYLGAYGFLVKPVSGRTLASSIRMAYSKHKISYLEGRRLSESPQRVEHVNTDNSIYFETLGGFKVYKSGAILNYSNFGKSKSGTRKTKSLLAYFVAKRFSSISREELIELFWPLSDWDAAAISLNRTMHSLRRALQPALKKREKSLYINYQDGLFKLNLEKIKVDIDYFYTHLKRGYAMLKEENEGDALKELTVATRLYAGDWMKSVQNAEDWCLSERQRLKDDYIKTKFTLAEIAKNNGQLEEALYHYQEAIEQDPYNDRINIRLTDIYQRLGKGNMAIKQKEIFNNRMKTIGVIDN